MRYFTFRKLECYWHGGRRRTRNCTHGISSVVSLSTFTAVLFFAAGCVNRASLMDSRASEDTPSTLVKEDESGRGAELWRLTEDKVFNKRVHTIEIRMNQGSYDSLYSDERANDCKSENPEAKFAHIRSFTFDDQRINNVAMRVRGNTSRCISRLQFSLRFNRPKNVFKKNQQTEDWSELNYPPEVEATIESQKLYGLQSLTLRRSPNDTSAVNDLGGGSLLREFVSSWTIAQTEKINETTKRGAPVYRVGYAKVIWRLCNNDGDRECKKTLVQAYNIAEEITPDFFLMRYDDPKPTVIQHNKACGFKPGQRFSTDCYDVEMLDGRRFDDSNQEQLTKARNLVDGTSGVMTLLTSETAIDSFKRTVDVDAFINYLMGASMVGHWDSAIGNYNNDYLYLHSPSNKWKIITWDLDNTFAKFANASAGLAEIGKDKEPVFAPIYEDPELRELFRSRMAIYLNNLHLSEDEGPLNEKIIEARDCYIGELNNRRPGFGKLPTEQNDLEKQLDRVCKGGRIWSSKTAQAQPDFVTLRAEEKMNVDAANPMFDFRRARYRAIKRDLQGQN
jgi:hypothetical protein